MNREELMRRLSAAQFAMWELHMYLDTHPSDKQAMSLYRKYEIKTRELMKEYEEKYGPLTFSSGKMAAEWLQNPWPWEAQGGMG
ncbi:MAG: spore coat protein CotJB [Oscillospiraceae bacterium]